MSQYQAAPAELGAVFTRDARGDALVARLPVPTGGIRANHTDPGCP